MTRTSTQIHLRHTRRYHAALACLVALTALALTACGEDSIGGGPLDGEVLDWATKQPIEGAIISVKWWGRDKNYGHGGAFCYYASTTVTDSQGRFHIPVWKQTFNQRGWESGVTPEGQAIKAYKRGLYYADVPKAPNPMLPDYRDSYKEIHNTTIYMEPDVSPPAERIERMRRSYSLGCYGGGDSQRSLTVLYRALYDEGNAIAVARDQRYWVDVWAERASEFK